MFSLRCFSLRFRCRSSTTEYRLCLIEVLINFNIYLFIIYPTAFSLLYLQVNVEYHPIKTFPK